MSEDVTKTDQSPSEAPRTPDAMVVPDDPVAELDPLMTSAGFIAEEMGTSWNQRSRWDGASSTEERASVDMDDVGTGRGAKADLDPGIQEKVNR